MPTPWPQPRPSSRNTVPADAAAGNARATSTAATLILIADRQSTVVRRLLLLTSAVVFFDTLFFAALTPLLPHFAATFGLGKTGAGVLAAAYPAGAFFGAIPSGIVAARLGVKPTVMVGLRSSASARSLFGVANEAWQLDVARFAQGLASAFSWTGALGWLVAASPAGRRGALIGRAFAAAVVGALFGPVIGGVASFAGIGWTFGAVAVASFGARRLGGGDPGAERRRAARHGRARARARETTDARRGAGSSSSPRCSSGRSRCSRRCGSPRSGFGAVAIGAVFLCSAALEAGNNIVVGQRLRPARPAAADHGRARRLDRRRRPPPLAGQRATCSPLLVVCAGLAFGTFFTPGMTMLSNLAEERGLAVRLRVRR